MVFVNQCGDVILPILTVPYACTKVVDFQAIAYFPGAAHLTAFTMILRTFSSRKIGFVS